MTWYVNVNGTAYGPYSEDQMLAFVKEGRVIDHSTISADPSRGYFAASAYEHYRAWKEQSQQTSAVVTQFAPVQAVSAVQTHPVHTNPVQSQPVQQHPAQTQPFNGYAGYAAGTFEGRELSETTSTVQSAAVSEVSAASSTPEARSSSEPCVFMIMAEIRSEGAMEFLRSVQGFGEAQRLGDTVWLLKSNSHVDELRNALSQHLDRQDRMFILNTQTSKTAWFNLGADLDSRIRKMWARGETH